MDPKEKVQTCPCCGSEMASGHAYCRRCGTPRENALPTECRNETWTCLTCGRQVPMDFHFCPHCGRPSIIPFYSYPFPAPQPEYRDDPTLVHFILFAISFIVPLLGFLLGFLLTRTEHSPEDRHAGRICILLAFVWPLIIILFLIRIMGII